jgi:excisionase family DNA binding protein
MTQHDPSLRPGTRKFLSTGAVANRLGVTSRTVRLWAEYGEITGIKIGRQWRFEQVAIEKWLTGLQNHQPQNLRHAHETTAPQLI